MVRKNSAHTSGQVLRRVGSPLLRVVHGTVSRKVRSPTRHGQHKGPRATAVALHNCRAPAGVVLRVDSSKHKLSIRSVGRATIQHKLCHPRRLRLLAPKRVRTLVLDPNFSAHAVIARVSNQNMKLSILHAGIRHLGNDVRIRSAPNRNYAVQVRLNAALTATRILLIGIGNRACTLPMRFIRATYLIRTNSVFALRNRDAVICSGRPVSMT